MISPPKPAATATEAAENTPPTKKRGRPVKLLGNSLNGAPGIKRAWCFRLDTHVPKGKRVDGGPRSDNDGRFIFKTNKPRPWVGRAHTPVKTARPATTSLPRDVVVGPAITPEMQQVAIAHYFLEAMEGSSTSEDAATISWILKELNLPADSRNRVKKVINKVRTCNEEDRFNATRTPSG